MKIIIDTPIWSEAFRRLVVPNRKLVEELSELIKEGRALLLGPIRQELLSGIKHKPHFDLLKNHLSAFEDLPIKTEDYEKAAQFYNLCRSKGIQGSNTDFLICSIAATHHHPIFTTDKDFHLYASHLPIHLHSPRSN